MYDARFVYQPVVRIIISDEGTGDPRFVRDFLEFIRVEKIVRLEGGQVSARKFVGFFTSDDAPKIREWLAERAMEF